MSDYRILFALRAGDDPFSEQRFRIDMFHCDHWNADWGEHIDPNGVKPAIKKAHKLMTGDEHPLIKWNATYKGMEMRMRFCNDMITSLLCIPSDQPMTAEELERVINCMTKERYHEFVAGAEISPKPPRMKR